MAVTTERIIYLSRNEQTGLSDIKIDIFNPSNTKVVNQGSMSELGNGLYYYDYTPSVAGWHAWVANSASEPSVMSDRFYSDYSTAASTSSTASAYATTIQLARFLNILKTVPDIDPAGASRARENVGTGDSSNLLFYLDYGRVLADSYHFYYGATESAALSNALTETTHYTLDKDSGTITLTTAGRTVLGTSVLWADYYYTSIALTDTQLQEVIDRAADQVDSETNSHFTDGTAATPDYESVSNEKHDGQGFRNFQYFSRKYPIPNVSTQLNGAVAASDATITVDSTAGFPSSGIIGIDTDKITYTGKTGTTFTGCSGVSSAHSDNAAVYPFVMEASITSPGSEPEWTVLDYGTDYDVDLDSGRFQLQSGQAVTGGNLNSYPMSFIANRVRLSYLFGFNEIPKDIVRLTLMLAAKELIYSTASHAFINATTQFQEITNAINDDWITVTISQYLNTKSDIV